MVTSFVVKVSRVKNRKNKDYFVYRVNIPAKAAKELQLGREDYLLMHAQKAEWYHLLDWSGMKKTWPRLPEDVKREIIRSGLPHPARPSRVK